ncbi:hypothetical protein GcM3_219041 [Golovinomyces cichoracearum]|uniref:FAR1 domain-containing protein n=1 Tax=Golovinomyces cichoracearum TaxID=62708 RepID=A0A420H797_9PEZI|nr:hypothetical protein GcM3_219041 [Golovinomyces cichoracearum]
MPTYPSDLPLPTSTATFQLGDALPDTTYPTLLQLIDAYKAHSRGRGYGVIIGSSSKGKRTILICDRGGKPRQRKQQDLHISKRRQSTTRACNCPFKIEARQIKDIWQGRILYQWHNHPATTETTSHPNHRRGALSIEGRAFVQGLLARHTAIATVLDLVANQFNVQLVARDIYNIKTAQRNMDIAGTTSTQWLVDTLQQKGVPFSLRKATSDCCQVLQKDVVSLEGEIGTILGPSNSPFRQYRHFKERSQSCCN